MDIQVDTIGSHTTTGASTLVHKLGRDDAAGTIEGVASHERHIEITGGSGTIKIEGSYDNSTWFDVATGLTPTYHGVIDDAIPYIRSNCTAHASGTVTVKATKHIE